MIKTYPAIIKKWSGGYSVDFPDIPNCVTQGDSLSDALFMASDALGIFLAEYSREEEPFPKPSTKKDIKLTDGEFAQYVQVDLSEYIEDSDYAQSAMFG